MNRHVKHLYNICFRSRHPEFFVFVPPGITESELVSRVVKDLDLNEISLPDVDCQLFFRRIVVVQSSHPSLLRVRILYLMNLQVQSLTS